MAATKSKATATATTSEKKKPVFVKVEKLKPGSTAATKSTATATTSENQKPVFVKVETLKPGSTAATKSTATATATTCEKKKPVFVKVETLKPGTHAHNLTVKVVDSNPVKVTGGGGGRGCRLSVNSRPPARISECVIGDETALSSSLLVTNKMYAREPVPPFVSIAEMVKKFQSNIREMSLPPMNNSTSLQRKHKLILTRPKQPEFATAKRVRPTRVKSSAEIEEEIPKFKARPLNKKIFESKGVLGCSSTQRGR
ncbi:hypothetical protein P3S67_020389 [Capsicum chacoense]